MWSAMSEQVLTIDLQQAWKPINGALDKHHLRSKTSETLPIWK